MLLFVVPRQARKSARGLLSSLAIIASITAVQAADVTLEWDPSPDANVIAYDIYYGPSAGTYTNMVSVGNVTNATVQGLLRGGTYYFAATAVADNGLESEFSNEISYTVPTTSGNTPPTLAALSDLVIDEGSPLQTVNLSGITSGTTNEVQTLTVTASSTNPNLIPTPAVTYTSPNATGSLKFTPVPYAFGSATITVTVNDGGTSNNVVSRSFKVTVNSVNQAPTLAVLGDLSIDEGSAMQTVNLSGITPGATNEVQTLTVTASSSNPSLIPTPAVTYTSPNATGSLKFTPVPYAFGSATITVTVNDGGTSNNLVSRSFKVAVNSVNQAPTLDSLADLIVNQGAGLQTVSLTGITSGATNEFQTLTVTATSSNPTLIPAPTVSYASPSDKGSIKFTPSSSLGGSATVSVTVNDGGSSNNVVSRSFKVTVNQLPTISGIVDQVIAASTSTTALPFTLADAETSAVNLTLAKVSSNQGLVPESNIVVAGTGTNRTVTVTPLPEATGYTVITLTVSDGTATASTSFKLTVDTKPPAPGNFHVVVQ